jgi:hypothetical protein
MGAAGKVGCNQKIQGGDDEQHDRRACDKPFFKVGVQQHILAVVAQSGKVMQAA